MTAAKARTAAAGRPFVDGEVPDYHLIPEVAVRAVPRKGLGVVALRPITAGELVECCPVLLLTPAPRLDANWRRLHRVMLETVFTDYIFDWGRGRGAVALGYGGLYNHSSHPNARTVRHLRERRMSIVALRDIAAGEEITISYNQVWFEPVE